MLTHTWYFTHRKAEVWQRTHPPCDQLPENEIIHISTVPEQVAAHTVYEIS